MGRRISLREFQENLVRRLAESRASDRRTLLGVEAGGEKWLVDLTDTGEILPVPALSAVPLTQTWFRGIANVRGTLYGVIDFSAFHQHAAVTSSGFARLLLLHGRHGVNNALLFSRTSGLHSPEEFEPTTENGVDQRRWVSGHLRDMHGNTWLRLDVHNLITHPSFLEAGVRAS